MKIDKLLLLSLLPLVSCKRSAEDVNKDLENIDSKFYKTGASLDILNEYDSILKELKDLGDLNKLNNVIFKHGLINYSLKRDKLALHDFENCITRSGDRNNGINNLCFEKFIELNLNLGKKSKILEKLNEVNGLLDENIKKSVLMKIEEYDELKEQLNKNMNIKDWGNCLTKSEEFLNIFKNDVEVRELRIQCILNYKDYGFNEKVKRLVEEYGKLLIDDENNLENFAKFSEISLFENRNVGKIIKNCLKIDNEFESCRKLSKINLKFDKVLNLIKEIDNYYSFVYMKLEEGAHGDLDRISELELETEDWKKLNNYLFEEDFKIKLKNENERNNLFAFNIEKFKNNYEVLIQLYLATFKKIGFEEDDILKNSSFLKNLNTMGKESFFQIGQFEKYKKNGSITKNRYFKKINENNNIGQDAVDICVEVDKLLAKRNIGKLKETFDGMAASLKKTRIINQRFEKFNSMMQQDEKHRQFAQQQQQQKRRQQQQQQQQQQYQQQQQQQQQYQQQPLKPKNDYYKVLGIGKDATDLDIKKAYREKMRQNHPDKIKKTSNLTDDQIEDKVAEINNAYEILSDSEKKQNYDRYGDDPNDPDNARRQQQHHQQQQQMHNPFGGFGFPQNGAAGGGHGFNFGGFNFDFGGHAQGPRSGQKRSGGRNRAGAGRRAKR